VRYAFPSTPHIASFKSFGARCCSGSPAWSKALSGVSFTRAYDDEGGTEDTTARFIASTINFFRGANGRVNAEGWEQVMEELEKSKIKMSLSGVKKIGGAYMKQMKAGVPMPEISLSRKRKGGYTSLTPLIARKMMEIQATHHGKLSSRRLCGKMKLENLDFSERPVFRWCNALGIQLSRR